MKTVDEIMVLVHQYRRAWVQSDDTNVIQTSHENLRSAIEAALKERGGEASISTEHGPWKASTYAGEEGEQYCTRCMLRDKFLGSRECTPRIVYTAPPKAQPMSDVGDSAFETWFSEYGMANKGTKQQMRDAYAAGITDAERHHKIGE